MKKRVFNCIFAILMIFTLLMSGCATTQTPSTEDPSPTIKVTPPPEATEAFVMHKVGDTVYINFENGNTYEHPEFVQVAGITFESLADMKRTIKNNSFTRSQAAIIKSSFPKDENGIKICDPDKLYQPTMPIDLHTSSVYLSGEFYSVSVATTNLSLYGQAHFWSKEDFESRWNRRKDYTYYSDTGVEKDETVEGIPAKAYYCSTNVCDIKLLVYSMELNGKKLRIIEDYILRADADSDLIASATIPDIVRIFGEEQGQYYEYYLSGFSTKPTVEWLSQFGVEEYKE